MMKPLTLPSCLLLTLLLILQSAIVSAVELDPILITASRMPISMNSTGSAVTVITSEELHDSQQTYIADVLRYVPGVAVSQTGSFGNFTQIRMRGSEANHVLVVIDGIEMNPGNGSGVNFAHLLSADVERVEILRGSQSTLWGSDAIGGVIAITTRRGQLGENKINALIQSGSFNTNEQSVGLSGGSKKTRYAISFNNVNSDGFSSADDDAFTYRLPNGSEVVQGGSGIENDAYNNRTIGGTIRHNFRSDFSIDAALRQIKSDVNYDAFEGARGVVDNTLPNTTSDAMYGQATVHYSIIDEQLLSKFKIVDTNIDDVFTGTSGSISNGRAKKRQYSFQLDYFFTQSEVAKSNHSISFALEREINSNDSSFSGYHENTSDSAIFEYRFEFDEDLSTALAYRRDNNNIFQNANIGHASLSYVFNPALRLHSSIGTGIKNPTLRELFGSNDNFPGNSNLKPEKSDSLDTGIDWRIGDAQSMDFTLFVLRINDQIIGSGNTSINVDGASKTTGLELSYQGKINKSWLLNGSFTAQDGEDANGNKLVRQANVFASMSATYVDLRGKLRSSLRVNYHGRQNDFYFDANFSRSLVEIAPYTVVNLSARYQLKKQLSLTGRIDNLFDETYQQAIGYGTAKRAYYLGVRFEL